MGKVYISCSHISTGGASGFGLTWGTDVERDNLVRGKGQWVCGEVGRQLHKTNLGSGRSDYGNAGLVFIPRGQKACTRSQRCAAFEPYDSCEVSQYNVILRYNGNTGSTGSSS